MMNNRQDFSDKIFSAIIIIFVLKVLYILFSTSGFAAFVGSVFVSIIIFFVLGFILRNFQDGMQSGGSSGSGSNIVIGNTLFDRIQQKYRDLAKKYIDEKEYRKASHIYFKLLNDKYSAAETLEEANLHNEAAVIYLKHLQNKHKAAECFEKGKSYSQAIKLQTELNNIEKVGDLHLLMNNQTEARNCFMNVIDEYKVNHQYVKASLIYRNKIRDTTEAQNLLLEGWRISKDKYNCLNNYFQNIGDVSQLNQEITRVYQDETNPENREAFMEVLKHEYKKDDSLKEVTRNIAYEIIAEKLETANNVEVISALISFNQDNKGITKDVIKFKSQSKRK